MTFILYLILMHVKYILYYIQVLKCYILSLLLVFLLDKFDDQNVNLSVEVPKAISMFNRPNGKQGYSNMKRFVCKLS
jgi:hypothetical protein